jgi:hypothetical protein
VSYDAQLPRSETEIMHQITPTKFYLCIIVIRLYNTVYRPYRTPLCLLLFIGSRITSINPFCSLKVLKRVDICIVNP